MTKISGTIITFNNEHLIEDCITSLKKICDEIVVVDSLSTDSTRDIAENLGAKVIKQKFLGDGPQKKLASTLTSNNWVFSLDADERLEDDLINFVKNLNLNDSKFDGYAFKRRNYCGKKWIKAGGFYPDIVTRLYDKRLANYHDSTSHSFVTASKIKKNSFHITHYTYSSYTDWVQKINFYSSQSAKTLHIKGVKPSRIRPVTHAIFAFFKKLFIKGAIFQGLDGFTVALTTMFNTYMKYIKLNELYDNQADPSKHFPKKD